MAFKTFVDGVSLPASDLNTYLMKQSVIVCTSGTRPSSPVEGMTIYETDTDLVRFYNGTAWVTGLTIGGWTSYTPGTFGNMTSAAGSFAYIISGKTLHLRYNFTGGTVTATATTYFALPSGILSANTRQAGVGSYSNAPAGTLVTNSDSSVLLFGTTGANLTAGDSLNKLYGNLTIEIA